MKRRVLVSLLFFMFMFLFPTFIKVEAIDISKYNVQDIKEVLKEENIKSKLGNYKETDEQVTVYLFRGNGCSYCAQFLNYVNNTLISKYGKYFKIRAFEVWYDSQNSLLFDAVAEHFGESSEGVPFIVIGDKVFSGYDESYNSEIEDAIIQLYRSKTKYDVFEEIKSLPTKTATSTDGTDATVSSTTVIIWNLVFTIISTSIILIFIHYKDKKINYRLYKIEKKQKALKNNK